MKRRKQQKTPVWAAPAVIILLALILLFTRGGESTPASELPRVFVVSKAATASDIKTKLREQGILDHPWLFRFFLFLDGGYISIEPGGYKLTEDPSMREIARVLTDDPDLLWITIPEGLRKEQIAERMAETFGWSQEDQDAFTHLSIPTPYGLTEGFYFPDTYLIPVDEDPVEVAKRMINRFTDQFAPFIDPFRNENVKYDTAMKLASIIQREAAGAHDMPLIAGVLWNRLFIDMKLEVDATLQYARGNEGEGYWAPINVSEKERDSLYNTYKYAGLPPQPISNPGVDAINAVLYPETTSCLFYLHAPDASIHCSPTYAGHLENIDEYLR